MLILIKFSIGIFDILINILKQSNFKYMIVKVLYGGIGVLLWGIN